MNDNEQKILIGLMIVLAIFIPAVFVYLYPGPMTVFVGFIGVCWLVGHLYFWWTERD